MTSRSKRKGSGYEREIVAWCQERGIEAERVPLSGAAKGSYAADIRLGPALGMSGECKRFATGLGKLYDALEQDGADMVFARADRRETIVCMSLVTFEALCLWLGWTKDAKAEPAVAIPLIGAVR